MPYNERGSILDSMLSVSSDEQGGGIFDILFPTKRKKLKMTTEVEPSQVSGMATLGLIGGRFRSKVLQAFETEIYSLQVSKDRKGRLELVEALLSVRRPMGEEGE